MKTEYIKRALYTAFVISAFLLSLQILYYGLTNSDWHDFDVFYSAAKAALSGKSIYIIIGRYHLPFWYFPWTAWFFIPFAIWPPKIALILYQCVSIISAILVINNLIKYYNPDFKFWDKILIFSLLIVMSLPVMIVGQMEYILLGLLLLAIYAIEQKKDVLAGLIFPFLWTKPHLVIIFTFFAFWRAGKRIILVSFASSALMLLLETVINPRWYLEMLNLLKTGGQRTVGLAFTTFPSLLGSQENWIGTANLPFTIALILLAFLIVWKYRSLPTVPLLSLSLAASLFCAPRAYAYDLPLLIPAIIWLTAKEFKSTFWIWIIASIFPLLIKFSSSTYLVTLLVFLLAIIKAHKNLYSTTGISKMLPESPDKASYP